MKTTRRVLIAANTQLRSQLDACNPESRKGLKAKLAAAREECAALHKANAALMQRLGKYEPELVIEAA
jgi:hypothetical protein